MGSNSENKLRRLRRELMSRELKIEDAAREWAFDFGAKNEYPISSEIIQAVAFEAGAQWADSNPIKYGGFTDDQFGIAPLHIHDECQNRYEVLKSKLNEAYKDFGKLQAENYKQAIKLNIAIEALEKIMKAGTGRQGNALYTEDAYEALAKINGC